MLAQELAVHHQRQWAAEDACRLAEIPTVAVEAKRLIDELNARRVALVEQLDQWARDALPAMPSASLHTETLGSVVDRLAIAWVRSQRLMGSVSDQVTARTALRQLVELGAAYDDLVHDVASGHRRLPDWRPLKRYGGSR